MSRFQAIKVRDYRITSLYLLTGDMVTTDHIPLDPTMCRNCGWQPKERGEDRYCAHCAYEIEGTTWMDRRDLEAARTKKRRRRPKVHPGVLTSRQKAVGDTSQGLKALCRISTR